MPLVIFSLVLLTMKLLSRYNDKRNTSIFQSIKTKTYDHIVLRFITTKMLSLLKKRFWDLSN